MIFLDFSQIIITSATGNFAYTKQSIDEPTLRFLALMNILSYKKKFNVSLNDMIICCDGKDYWRKQVFPFYKQNRKRMKDRAKFDWANYYKVFSTIKDEIRDELKYKVIEVYGCEADDIIAVLSKHFCDRDNIIISNDKDLLQIQETICPSIKQWSPTRKKYITSKDRDYSLFEHIVRGDSGDGIPNILSDDDVFIDDDKRSKQLRSSTIKEWQSIPLNSFCNAEMKSKFNRNQCLIDLRYIPDEYTNAILVEYNKVCKDKESASSNSLFNYISKHRMRKLIEMGLT